MSMNKQTKNGIEWTNYTWNPVSGCHHGCQWVMPDGSIAECYAKAVAERFRSDTFYPEGFSHVAFHVERLSAPSKLATPARIFIDSMSDLLGAKVKSEWIEQVLDVARQNPRHHFQMLTKNPGRILQFAFPSNVWVGVSAPPTVMNGHRLNAYQMERWTERALHALGRMRRSYEYPPDTVVESPVRWMSIEPLSFNIAPILWECAQRGVLDWVVIGAATNGRAVYQPEPRWVESVLNWADCYDVPVFFKGNLRGNPAITRWREEFPVLLPGEALRPPAPVAPYYRQMALFGGI